MNKGNKPEYREILYEIRDQVAWVTINRPEVRNAFREQTLDELIHALRDEGRTVILVEHVMDAIRSLCDRCVVMASGRKIAEGRPDEVLGNREVVRAYLGDDDA